MRHRTEDYTEKRERKRMPVSNSVAAPLTHVNGWQANHHHQTPRKRAISLIRNDAQNKAGQPAPLTRAREHWNGQVMDVTLNTCPPLDWKVGEGGNSFCFVHHCVLSTLPPSPPTDISTCTSGERRSDPGNGAKANTGWIWTKAHTGTPGEVGDHSEIKLPCHCPLWGRGGK